MANALVSIQILPKTKNNEDIIPYVDRAIEVITQSGVKHLVSQNETTTEGELINSPDKRYTLHFSSCVRRFMPS
jgi:uncharacterized protein YqgV (UPF0045/DUF77 family)